MRKTKSPMVGKRRNGVLVFHPLDVLGRCLFNPCPAHFPNTCSVSSVGRRAAAHPDAQETLPPPSHHLFMLGSRFPKALGLTFLPTGVALTEGSQIGTPLLSGDSRTLGHPIRSQCEPSLRVREISLHEVGGFLRALDVLLFPTPSSSA